MGRSGGFGGGFSGGGRSSGGFSGGGRSDNSFGSGRSRGDTGGMGGGFGGFGFPSIPIIVNAPRFGGGSNGGFDYDSGQNGPFDGGSSGNGPDQNSPSGGGPAGNSPKKRGFGFGCGTAIAVILVLVVIFALISMFMGGSDDSSVASSTVAREALPASAVTETPYYTDADGGWIGDKGELEQGMRSFFKETGVQPYLYIMPNGATSSADTLAARADDLYGQLFSDEGHFLLVFCDDDRGSFNCGYALGSQAKTIMDDEAVGILADYLDRYYNDYSISEEEIFSKAFADTGTRIMTVTKSPVVPIVVCIVVVIVAALAFFAFKKHREQQERERQRTERILNTPLETYGDQTVEDLADKYEDADMSASAQKFSDQDVESLAEKYEDKIPTDNKTGER